jgi:hypothetical protein
MGKVQDNVVIRANYLREQHTQYSSTRSFTFNLRPFWPAWTLFRLRLIHCRQHFLILPTFDQSKYMIPPISRHIVYQIS